MGRNLGAKADARVSTNTRQAEQHHQPKENPRSSSFDVELKLGWDHANRRSVAMKTFRTFPSAFQDDTSCSQLVEYEIKSMDRVASHQNIVRLVDIVVRSPSNICLVMEAATASHASLMETIAAAPEGR